MKQLSVYNIFCKIHFRIHVTQVNLGINLFPKLKQFFFDTAKGFCMEITAESLYLLTARRCLGNTVICFFSRKLRAPYSQVCRSSGSL